ncbi:hypothetical protein OAT01_09840 [Pseudomonadales bacterium]|nr:hypothetical protein [Pseudomonadales bacterium]
MNFSFKKTLLGGVLTGSIISITVTIFITLWEWIENPGGIFRDSDGTRWRFVFDTALSWLWPTFLIWTCIGILIYLTCTFARQTINSDVDDANH